LGSGLDIRKINSLRKKLSCIKGGKLTALLANRKTLALLISDVPGDDLSAIGSGLLVPDTSTENNSDQEIPGWLQTLLEKSSSVELDPDQDTIRIEIIARIADAMQAAAAKAVQLGYEAFIHDEILQGDTIETGKELVQEIINSSPGVHIWGGETTIQLPDSAGIGGRNQSLALSAAIEMQGIQGLYLLAAGTDGTDGPGEDAGALVDGKTVERGRIDNLEARESLAAADAGTFLQASGDLIQTGPTGTNVMDLVIGLKVEVVNS
jgi:hydroxypyruvate reductase